MTSKPPRCDEPIELRRPDLQPLLAVPGLQDWADFTDVAAQAVAALDAGQLADKDVYERIRPGYLYHVSCKQVMVCRKRLWGEQPWASRCDARNCL